MWKLYDELIAAIPEEIYVDAYCAGMSWTMVQAGENTGVAMSARDSSRPRMLEGPYQGLPLRRLAECAKSWDLSEASIGAAAINAWHNRWNSVSKLPGFDMDPRKKPGNNSKNAFVSFLDEAAGKKVAVVGHFPHIEIHFGPICELTILEREPGWGDYPDPACEYLLPEQDYVFITGMTLINKTLPRLLQIVKGRAKVSLVGPTVPMAPLLRGYGVSNLSGFIVTEPDRLDDIVRRGRHPEIFQGGTMVSLDL